MALLKSRGLVISDEDKAVRYLESIGYYRLSAYMYPFLKVPKETHQYKDGTTFQQVLNLYRFDKKLRMLLLNEIEKVEIAIRRAIMNIPVQMTGDSYWLTNSVHFANQRTFTPKVVSATEIVESRILFRDIALEISLPPSLPERFMHA